MADRPDSPTHPSPEPDPEKAPLDAEPVDAEEVPAPSAGEEADSAAARPARPADPREAAISPNTGSSDDDILVVDDEAIDTPGEQEEASAALGAAISGQAGPARGPGAVRRPKKKRNNMADVKAVAIPLLATVGVMLLFPAIWAVLILRGHETLASDKPDAETMAMVMLVCWPIALILIAAAATFGWQVFVAGQAKKREKELNTA